MSHTIDAATQSIVDNAETSPLDLLNKWWAGLIDDQSFHTLMQRALLAAQAGRTPMANSAQFAAQRKNADLLTEVGNKAKTEAKCKAFLEELHVALRKDNRGWFSISTEAYLCLLRNLIDMYEGGFRLGKHAIALFVDGNYESFTAYYHAEEFFKELDRLIAGNRGEL